MLHEGRIHVCGDTYKIQFIKSKQDKRLLNTQLAASFSPLMAVFPEPLTVKTAHVTVEITERHGAVVTLSARIRAVPGSNSGRDIGYHNCGREGETAYN